MCVLYSQLSAEATRQQKKLWKFSPKHHLFQHLCEWQALTHGNPAHYWTYSDEDLVGHMIEVHARAVTGTALFKWLSFSFDTE